MATESQRFSYLTCCVHSDGESITAMTEKAREVSLRTFTRRCDWRAWARTLGYAVGPSDGLHLADDWHVRYHKSTYQGQPCYYAKHSGIEHIFTHQPNTKARIVRPW